MDRTVATGTGYVAQYSSEVAKQYESQATTPDELLLFFHHVPYTYKLHSEKTVIQHIYDSHYDGATRAAAFVTAMANIKRPHQLGALRRCARAPPIQASHTIVWRDAVCEWLMKASDITDDHGRVGHHQAAVR